MSERPPSRFGAGPRRRRFSKGLPADLAACAIILLAGGMLSAQALGDVARQEEARRKAVASPGKVYTNESLRPVTPAPAPVAAPAAPDTAPPADADPPEAAPGEAPGTAPQGEAAWRARIEGARSALARAQLFQEALQTRVNALSADFTARDDPAQRAVVGAERQKALDELARLKEEIVEYTKAVAAIQEDARRAGVPPGWLR